jgi:tetratricopeptide (TPR) repeat protein
MWGNLGDAYYWSPGRRAEARSAYNKAIALGEEKLRVNPQDPGVLSYLAMYHATCDERKAALQNLDAALRFTPKSPDLLFTAGIVYQQLGDTSVALDSIEKAVAGRFSPATSSDTPNFDTLRSKVPEADPTPSKLREDGGVGPVYDAVCICSGHGRDNKRLPMAGVVSGRSISCNRDPLPR